MNAGAETRRLVEAAGLEVLEAEVEEQVEQGSAIPYLWLLGRRPLSEDD
ncbi:MAG TPA: hypothetical protein VI540_07905 [Gaiellaceae bacterium]|nr:hypothetical protein [Gaiellaceae bacterium]